MKRFLFGLILGIGLSAVVGVKAQSPPPLSVSDCDNPPMLRTSLCPEPVRFQAVPSLVTPQFGVTWMACPGDPRCPSEAIAVNPVNPHEHDLTVKEIVEILADMEVRHAPQQPFFKPAYGATTFDTDPPQIWIFTTGDIHSKISTVIHELVHAHCHAIGVDCPEEYVASEEQRQYQKLFGVQ